MMAAYHLGRLPLRLRDYETNETLKVFAKHPRSETMVAETFRV